MKYPELRKYQDESWYSHILHLWEFGFCMPEKRKHIYGIIDACHDLNYYVIHRRFSNKDYILKTSESGRLWSYSRLGCLYRFEEKIIKELEKVSEGYDYKTPKVGMITEWQQAQEDYYMLLQMMDEIPHNVRCIDKSSNPVSVYVGSFDGWTALAGNIIEDVYFGVLHTSSFISSLDKNLIFKITHDVAEQWIKNDYYDEERHRRYDEDKSTLLRTFVNSNNYIIRLEWVEYGDKLFNEQIKESFYESIESEKRIRHKIRKRNSRQRKPIRRRFAHHKWSNNGK